MKAIRSFLLAALVVAFATSVQAQSLKLADRQHGRTVTAHQLLSNLQTRTITVRDPAYGRSMTYRALPLAELLKELAVGPEDYVDFVATDKFSIGIPVRLLRGGAPQPFLAIESEGAPWPALPEKGRETAAPFYLVWQDAKPGEISPEYWVYKLAAVQVADSPYKRWPDLRVGGELPATDPAHRGLDRFVALCISCHRFKGAGDGEQGPDLGQPMNPVEYFQPGALRKFLRSSKQVRDWPQRRMPSFNEEMLSDEDLEAIIAWLTYKARR
ncbi:MAG: cytochrome c [Proteobacteria bacterium]|nr:cytochrome c [Pseudomonadota bacterium]